MNRNQRNQVAFNKYQVLPLIIVSLVMVISLTYLSNNFSRNLDYVQSLHAIDDIVHEKINIFLLENHKSSDFEEKLKKEISSIAKNNDSIEDIEIYKGELLGINKDSFIIKNPSGITEIKGNYVDYSDLTTLRTKNDIVFKIKYKERTDSIFSSSLDNLYLVTRNSNYR